MSSGLIDGRDLAQLYLQAYLYTLEGWRVALVWPPRI